LKLGEILVLSGW